MILATATVSKLVVMWMPQVVVDFMAEDLYFDFGCNRDSEMDSVTCLYLGLGFHF